MNRTRLGTAIGSLALGILALLPSTAHADTHAATKPAAKQFAVWAGGGVAFVPWSLDAGVAWLPVDWLELNAGGWWGRRPFGWSDAAETTQMGGSARARAWLFERHSALLEVGLGARHATTKWWDGLTNEDRFSKPDTPPSGTQSGWMGNGHIGAGYGYRGGASWRVTLVGGLVVPFAQPLTREELGNGCGLGNPQNPDCVVYMPKDEFVTQTEMNPYMELTVQWFVL